MKKIIKYGVILLALILVLCIFMFAKESKEVNELQFNTVDISEIRDGTYYGEENTTLVKAAVEVTVKEGKIQEVTLVRHDNGLGEKAEKIINSIRDKNTYDVDCISGATISSQVIKRAVNDALVRQLPVEAKK